MVDILKINADAGVRGALQSPRPVSAKLGCLVVPLGARKPKFMIRDHAAIDWWNNLTREQRLAVAGELPTEPVYFGSQSDWTLPWERLRPFTQQMRLQM